MKVKKTELNQEIDDLKKKETELTRKNQELYSIIAMLKEENKNKFFREVLKRDLSTKTSHAIFRLFVLWY